MSVEWLRADLTEVVDALPVAGLATERDSAIQADRVLTAAWRTTRSEQAIRGLERLRQGAGLIDSALDKVMRAASEITAYTGRL